MSLGGSCQFPTIWLLSGVGDRYRRVDTVMAAAQLLLHDWPARGGDGYMNALQACLDALQANGPIDAVPVTLIRAADEAFMCHLSLVKAEMFPHREDTDRRCEQNGTQSRH